MTWRIVKLGDVCSINNGGTPKSKVREYWDGGVQWLTPKDMGKLSSRYVSMTGRQISQEGLDNSSAKIIPEESVVLSCRAPIGHLAINRVPMSFNQGCKGLVPTDKILVEYLYYFLISSKQLLNDLGTGTTFKEISAKTLHQVDVPLPPLAEQQRIVAKLDAAFAEIDEAINKAEAKETEVQKLKASLLSKVIDDQSLNLTPLGEAIQIARGGSPRPIKSFITNDDNGVNWIKIGDTEQGDRYIYSTKEKIKPSGVSRSRFVKDGDFLLSNSMSFGRPYILKTSGCIHDGWLVLSEYQKLFSSDYLYYLLSSSYVQNQFEILARGSTVRNLNIDLVSKVLVPIPSLINQKKITEKLDLAFQKFEEHQHSISKNQMNYKLLKSSILSKELQSGIAV